MSQSSETQSQPQVAARTRSPRRSRLALFSTSALAGVALLGAAAVFWYNPAPANAQLAPFANAPASFADLVEQVKPAVVSINVSNGGGPRGSGPDSSPRQGPGFEGFPDLPDDHPFNEFFKRFMPPRGFDNQPQRRMPSQAQGSGFFISADGYLVTNNHVIDEADDISITMDDGTRLPAKLVGTDERTDLALLKVDGRTDLPFVPFAETEVRVGDWVLAVGNPFGLGGTVTAGIVSARGRDIGSGPYDYLQIDAAVNRGNSGGPTFNLKGEVVGVNTAIYSPSGGNVGIAFAVPSSTAERVIAELRDRGSVSRGWLGVTIQSMDEKLAQSFGLTEPKGALVNTITENGPAAKGDISIGDVILEVNGQQVADSRDLARKIADLKPDTTASLLILRNGERKTVEILLGQFPGSKELAALTQQDKKPAVTDNVGELGLTLAPASSRPGAGDTGVVITAIAAGSIAQTEGLREGDVILRVSGKEVTSPAEVADGVKEAKDAGRGAINMLIKSGDRPRFVAIPFKK